jgi:YegS/Rv2252/BmrU family lipid kinase
MNAIEPEFAVSPRIWSRVALIVNARSRNGTRLFAKARELLDKAGIDPFLAQGLRDPSAMVAAVEQALRQRADLIIVGGGDGTISGTIGTLAGSEAVFAPLPLGTANSFARTLDYGADLEAAVAAIAAGQVARIDLAEIDGHLFANSAAIGVSPMIGDTIPPRLKRWLGRFGYLIWAIRTMIRFRPFLVTVEGEGAPSESWATEVRILNGRFSGGIQLSEEARLDDGTIRLQIVSGKSRWRLALDWYRRILGLGGKDEAVIELRGHAFGIATRPAQKVAIDGEVLARTPIAVKIHRRTVNLVVPHARI